jgi:putative transposase
MFPSKPFDSLQAAREWVQGFVRWYNETDWYGGIRFVAPAERHRGQDREILAKRETVYAAAKPRHLERWS